VSVLPTNMYDYRHRILLERLERMLVRANIPATLEPGVLGGEALPGDARPDHVLTVFARDRRALLQKATDVSVVEPNTAANVLGRRPRSVLTVENDRARQKVHAHQARMAALGLSFDPLVFSSLGHRHAGTVKFLKMEFARLDDDRLSREFGSVDRYLQALSDAMSCALAHGTSAMVLEAATRVILLQAEAQQHRAARWGRDPGPAPPAAAAAGAPGRGEAAPQAPVMARAGDAVAVIAARPFVEVPEVP
jgi:hypothetical protein